jgi:hypothetical protein
MKSLWLLSIALFCAITVSGQAVVEYSLGTAGASAAGTRIEGAGAGVAGVFGALTQTLQKAGDKAVSSAITPAPEPPVVQSKPVDVKPVETKPIDPAQVSVGLDRAEMIKRCGDPATLTTETKNSKFIETFAYNTTTHDVLEIKVMDGKVASITPLSSKKRPAVAVVLN